MQDSGYKQRIIGAIVVVALVVVFVPMLFQADAPPAGDHSPAAHLPAPDAPTQIITLIQDDPPAAAAPAPHGGAPAPLPPIVEEKSSAAPTAAIGDVVDWPAPASAVQGRSAQAAPRAGTPTHGGDAVTWTPAVPEPRAEAAAPRPVEPPPKPARSTAPRRSEAATGARTSSPQAARNLAALEPPPSAKPKPGGGAWMVQLGAFTRRSSAFALSQRARGKGYTSFVQEIAKDDSRKLFHVRIGPQPNRQAAESLRRRVEQDLRLSAIVTRSP